MALAGSLHTAVISGMEMVMVVPECLSLPRDFGAITGWFVKESYRHLESGVLLNMLSNAEDTLSQRISYLGQSVSSAIEEPWRRSSRKTS